MPRKVEGKPSVLEGSSLDWTERHFSSYLKTPPQCPAWEQKFKCKDSSTPCISQTLSHYCHVAWLPTQYSLSDHRNRARDRYMTPVGPNLFCIIDNNNVDLESLWPTFHHLEEDAKNAGKQIRGLERGMETERHDAGVPQPSWVCNWPRRVLPSPGVWHRLHVLFLLHVFTPLGALADTFFNIYKSPKWCMQFYLTINIKWAFPSPKGTPA